MTVYGYPGPFSNWEFEETNTLDAAAVEFSITQAQRVTAMHVYGGGRGGPVGGNIVLWDGSWNEVITVPVTFPAVSDGTGAQTWTDVGVNQVIQPGTYRVGWRRDPAGSFTHSIAAGTCYHWHVGDPVATYPALVGAYIDAEPAGAQVYVRRSGVWVQAQVYVRRSGAWVPAQVQVRRSGVWGP